MKDIEGIASTIVHCAIKILKILKNLEILSNKVIRYYEIKLKEPPRVNGRPLNT